MFASLKKIGNFIKIYVSVPLNDKIMHISIIWKVITDGHYC